MVETNATSNVEEKEGRAGMEVRGSDDRVLELTCTEIPLSMACTPRRDPRIR